MAIASSGSGSSRAYKNRSVLGSVSGCQGLGIEVVVGSQRVRGDG